MSEQVLGTKAQWQRDLVVASLAVAIPAAWADNDSATGRHQDTAGLGLPDGTANGQDQRPLKGDLPFDKALLELGADLPVLLSKSTRLTPLWHDWQPLPREDTQGERYQLTSGARMHAACSTWCHRARRVTVCELCALAHDAHYTDRTSTYLMGQGHESAADRRGETPHIFAIARIRPCRMCRV